MTNPIEQSRTKCSQLLFLGLLVLLVSGCSAGLKIAPDLLAHAENMLYTCLFATRGHDLRKLLRSEPDDKEVSEAISSIWRNRTDRYSEIRSSETRDLPKVEMSYIGG